MNSLTSGVFGLSLNDFYLETIGEKYCNAFPLSIHSYNLKNSCFFSQLTNNSVISYTIEKGSIEILNLIDNLHDKRINEIFVDENVLFSCSNDCTVKLWDLNSNKLIKAFKSLYILEKIIITH